MSRLITEPKFLYKNCHFSERRSCSFSKSLKKMTGRRVAGERKGRGRIHFPPCLFYKNSLVSAPLKSEAYCFRLRGNGCINELIFFSEDTFSAFFPPLSLSSPHSGDCIKPLTLAFYPLSCSLAFILHFTGAFGRLQIFYLLQPRREEISETSPKVCKDVPFYTEKNCRVKLLEKRRK